MKLAVQKTLDDLIARTDLRLLVMIQQRRIAQRYINDNMRRMPDLRPGEVWNETHPEFNAVAEHNRECLKAATEPYVRLRVIIPVQYVIPTHQEAIIEDQLIGDLIRAKLLTGKMPYAV